MGDVMNERIAALATAFCLGVPAAYADDVTYDPRSLALGGTGVTTSNTRNAVFHNPAMLASNPRDSFAVEAPILSARLQDENGMMSDVHTLKNNANNLTAAMRAFQAAQAANNMAGAQAAAVKALAALNGFNSALVQIDHKSLTADLFGGAMAAVPSKDVALALYVDGHAQAAAMFKYAQADQQIIRPLLTDLNGCAAGSNASCQAALISVNADGQVAGLQSQLLVRGVLVKELGLSAAHHFESIGGLDIGITPKAQQIKTYDYAAGAQQGATVVLNRGENN